MKKEFIPYEQALELKQLGFNYQCFAAQKDNLIDYGSEMYDFIYNADLTDKTEDWVALPTYQQAFRWFREKYDGIALIQTHSYGYNGEEFKRSYHPYVEVDGKGYNLGFLPTYEEAELACLKKLIEIVKINNEPILHNNHTPSS